MDSPILTIITAVSAGLLAAILISGAVIVVKLRALAREFTAAPSEGELSPLALLTQAVASQFAETLFLRVRQQIGGTQAAITRQEKAISQESVGAAIEDQSPLFSMLLDLMPPNVKKRVTGNPAAAMALIGMLGNPGSLGGKKGANVRSNDGGKSSKQFSMEM